MGYHVGHVGKWQYSDPDNLVPTELFDWTRLHEGRHQWPNKRRGKEGKVIPYRGDIISAAELTRADVSDFLKERPKDKPFALTAAFYPPKAIGASMEPGGQWFPMNYSRALYENATIPMPPYNITESHRKLPPPFTKHEKEGWHRWNQRFSTPEKYQEAMKNYYALVTEVDQACKEIYEELEQQGLLDNTLIIFTTDNGLFHAEHGLAGKWYPYQESIRVPLIIRDPRMQRDKINTLDDDLTLNIDLAPTILGAAGISTPKHMQGRNIADLYVKDGNNKDPWRNEFYYEFPVDHKKKIPMSEAVVRHDIKYIYWPEFGSEELFNLTADPLEQNNIYEDPQYEEILNELRELKDIYKAAVV